MKDKNIFIEKQYELVKNIITAIFYIDNENEKINKLIMSDVYCSAKAILILREIEYHN